MQISGHWTNVALWRWLGVQMRTTPAAPGELSLLSASFKQENSGCRPSSDLTLVFAFRDLNLVVQLSGE